MVAVTFDTLRFVKTLEDASFDKKQAEAISRAFQDAQRESEFATKADIRILETKIDSLKTRIDSLKTEIDSLKNDINSLRWILGIIVILTVIPLVKGMF
ncbi:MAG: hypothetical protein BECKG1743D_GA0114223_100587 [Candidatus Kentron sp. G]|nr:MAG: hypothetical protein BECKG1743F_GA0114225_100387 [Candidatus Kentron sp. G]VFM97985.1 MAG: hypothetical protein BECKG1743E_GA0114224_101613 [Candidatus Kentron sp. G]VFM98353.1 MAG: hypothetical protein BECKG1743D_GA0114223_100587 [Candidatus Kentron sp. G]